MLQLKNGVFWVVTPCGSCNTPEDTILHSHRRENLKSYNVTVAIIDYSYRLKQFPPYIKVTAKSHKCKRTGEKDCLGLQTV
jgi:hypothetical protein